MTVITQLTGGAAGGASTGGKGQHGRGEA